jgi:uncharacterized protein YuzE
VAVMEATYDPEADAAYIRLRKSASISETYACEDLPQSSTGQINLDFTKEGKLVGIEVLYASEILAPELLERFTKI